MTALDLLKWVVVVFLLAFSVVILVAFARAVWDDTKPSGGKR